MTETHNATNDIEAFEVLAKYQGLQDFTKAEDKTKEGDIPATSGGFFSPATYYNYVTELAWRVWANKRVPTQSATVAQSHLTRWNDNRPKILQAIDDAGYVLTSGAQDGFRLQRKPSAAQQLTELVLPKLPNALVTHPELGELYDRIQMHMYATKHAEEIAQLLDTAKAALDDVTGCFRAAEVEGLSKALAETSDEHLKDLVERRLMYALYAVQELEKTT